MPRRRMISWAIVTSICTRGVRPNLRHISRYTFDPIGHTEHKYSHIGVWSLVSGYVNAKGERQFPSVAMVANLAKPTLGRSALMAHEGTGTLLFGSVSTVNRGFHFNAVDVVSFIHELGHVVHGLLSRTKFSRFHGVSR